MFMSGADAGRPSALRGFLGHWTGLFWFILFVIAPIPVFMFGFRALVDAWSTPEYSHGPLIPLLSGYMFMREMAMVPPTREAMKDRGPGFALIAFALAVAVLGNLVRIPDIVTYAMILWVGGLVLVCFGWKRGIFFWPSVLHLVFMLPIPQFLYWQITITLQFISSEIGVWMVRMAGIPVFLDGNIIDLGVYKLQVAEACSGLRYLFPIMSFSYIFCVLYRGPWPHKAILLLAAVPLAVLMNSVRIGIIGILVDNYGIEQAEGFLHFFEGWVIFGACIAILFLLAKVMQWTNRDRRPLSEALDLDLVSLGPQFARAKEIVPSRALVSGALLALAVSVVWLAAPRSEPAQVERADFDVFPRQLKSWTGTVSTLEPDIERVLAADDYYTASYVSPDAAANVDFFVAYYDKLTEGSGIHSPEVCLPTGGWEVFDIEPHRVDLAPEAGVAPFEVNRAIIQKGESRMLVYYWFEQRGRRMINDFVAKGYTVYDSLTMGRTDGALVRLVTAMGRNESDENAEARLEGFMALAMQRLPEFVPGR